MMRPRRGDLDRRSFLGVVAGGLALGPRFDAGEPLRATGEAAASDPLRALGPPQRRLRVLVLGGTNYVGPRIVEAALARGHEVTMFNRGYHNPDLFPHVERLVGERFPDRGHGLSALAGAREWDLVVDTWAAEPGCVQETVRLLASRVGRYVYVSSTAVLGGFRRMDLDETSSAVDAAEHVGSFDPELGYAAVKRAGELAVLEGLGARGAVLRCSGIWGLDPTGAQLSYWGVRFLSGEPFLVPDDPGAVVQWTDVRDVGTFAVFAGEEGLGGVFHVINPPEPVPLLDVLHAWNRVAGGRARMVPAPRAFIDRHGLVPWVDIPHYVPDDDPEPGFYRVGATRAHATGFPFRALAATIADEAATCPLVSPALAPRGSLDRARELRLIAELTRG